MKHINEEKKEKLSHKAKKAKIEAKELFRHKTLCKSSKAMTTEAAQNCAADSPKGLESMEDKGQARRVFNSNPAYMRSAEVHKTCGIQAEELIPLIKSFSFKTCASFPSLFTFGLENLFKVSKLSASKNYSVSKLHFEKKKKKKKKKKKLSNTTFFYH